MDENNQQDPSSVPHIVGTGQKKVIQSTAAILEEIKTSEARDD